MEKKAPIQVVIVEDDPKLRSLYQMMIDEEPDFICSFTYPLCKAALTDFKSGLPDVVLMDVDMPELSGIQCVKIVREFAPTLPILMLTVHEDDEILFDALCTGATGYLLKGLRREELLQAIRDAHDGGAPMSPSIARRVVESFRNETHSTLSPRENEVLQLLCDGEVYTSVAAKLFISKNTVKRHIRSIYGKLQVSSRAEMVAKAYTQRLVK